MNVPALLLGLGFLVYGLTLRHLAHGWRFAPARWDRRTSAFLTGPSVMFTDETGAARRLVVSRFALYQEEPLKLLVNERGTRGMLAGTELWFMALGAGLIFLQIVSLFPGF